MKIDNRKNKDKILGDITFSKEWVLRKANLSMLNLSCECLLLVFDEVNPLCSMIDKKQNQMMGKAEMNSNNV